MKVKQQALDSNDKAEISLLFSMAYFYGEEKNEKKNIFLSKVTQIDKHFVTH